jgi:hypothetical protein
VNTRAILVSLLALTLSACGKTSTPTQPTQADPVFQATLLPINEVPAISNAEASGSGTVTITIDRAAGTATFAIAASGFPASTAMTMSHIHPGKTGVTGGIFLGTGQVAGEVTLTNGSGSWTKTAKITDDQLNQLLADSTAFYFNIHTALNPAGVARGQLSRLQ